MHLFEDDCVLYRNIHSIQDCFILQEDLTSLGQWEADWQMKFNVAKCHSMRVTRHQHHKQILFDYSLHNQTLENVQSAKYLGITISDNMDWGQHISEISSKATKTLGFLRRSLAFAPRSTKEVAYKTLVRPKLENAAPIWSPYSKLQINQVEKVQRTAARWTCRRWRNTSSVGEMLDELEWPSLEVQTRIFFHVCPIYAYVKVSNGAKIRNRYNQVPHLTQDTNGKVTLTEDTTNESQEVSPFPAGDQSR